MTASNRDIAEGLIAAVLGIRESVETLTDLASVFWHIIEGIEPDHPDTLQQHVHVTRRLYECARRCCAPGTKQPDLDRWAREAPQGFAQ